LRKSGEKTVDPVTILSDFRAIGSNERSSAKILIDCQLWKHSATFWDLADTRPDDREWLQSIDPLAKETDLTSAGLHDPADRHQKRRLAGPVGADCGDDLALTDPKTDTAQCFDRSIGDD
jgi:hypothetical protein